MDWAILIFEILLTVAVFLIGLFVKNYLPSYMDEKGKNLATKEDIEEITRKTEEVQQEFREGFELFSTTFNISKANGSSVTRKTEEIETPISQFNKKELCDYIISNGSLASQKLLKLAVAYRFAADHYSGNGSGGSIDVKDIADEEEFRMIKDIVVAIVQDYNLLRKELKLDYNENEIKTGIPEL